MAAVDQRLGVVRRGATPAAPKPINLPSQKYENYRLIPDVEIVPRGTCCWGNALRSTPDSGKSIEKTDSSSLSSGINDTEDHDSQLQNDSLHDEVQSPAGKLDLTCSDESSTLPAASSACVTLVETCNACPSLGNGNSMAKAVGDSSTDSDASSFPESVARPSSSESYSTSPVSPTKVEEQKYFSGFFEVNVDEYEKVSNIDLKQEAHASKESPQESQDFGYFEGLYSTHSPFSRPGVPYPNGMGMVFGPGMHPEPPHHYSFLGVPYYDSAKDKEVVVITMVGNPGGVYGNYLPHPTFPEYGRPSVHGNFPLQFGHFENFVEPQFCPEMNPMCSGEDSGYVCYEQGNHKYGWVNGSSVSSARRDNSTHFSAPYSMHQYNPVPDDFSMPKRTGRPKAANWNRKGTLREASSPVFPPERRVTLLTKVSQHEVIISNMHHRKSRHGGIRQAKSVSNSHFYAEDVREASMESSVLAPQPTEASPPMELSNTHRLPNQPSVSPYKTDQVTLESIVAGEVDAKKSCAPHTLEYISAHETLSLQLACKRSNGGDSILEPRCHEDAQTAVSDHCKATPSARSPTSTLEMTFQAQNTLGTQDQGTSDTCSSVIIEVPASSVKIPSAASVESTIAEHEVSFLSKAEEIQLGSSSESSSKSAYCMVLAGENGSDNATLSTLAARSLLNKQHKGEPVQKLASQKNIKKWRQKGSVQNILLGHEGFEVQSSVERTFLNDISRVEMHPTAMATIPSPRKSKPLFESSVPLSSCAPAALSNCDVYAASSWTTGNLVDTESNKLQMIESSTVGAEAGLSTTAYQPNKAIPPTGRSNDDRAQIKSGFFCSRIGQAGPNLEVEVDVEERCAPDNIPAHETFSPQSACRGSNAGESVGESRCIEDAQSRVSEPCATSTSTPVSTSKPEINPRGQIKLVAQDQVAPATTSATVPFQVPASRVETVHVSVNSISFNPEARVLSKAGEIYLGCSSGNLTMSAMSMGQLNEHARNSENLSASTAEFLSKEHTADLMQKLAAQKSTKMWRRKEPVDVSQQGQGGAAQNVQDSAVDESALSQHSATTAVMHAAGSLPLPSSPSKVKPLSAESSSFAPAIPLICDDHAGPSKISVPVVDTKSNNVFVNKNRKVGFEAGFLTSGGFECAPEFCQNEDLDTIAAKTVSAGGQTLFSRVVSCGVGRKWKAKLSGSIGHDNLASEDSRIESSKVAAGPVVSGLQSIETGTVSGCTDSLEVLSLDDKEDDHKQNLNYVDSSKYVEDEGDRTLLNTGLPASKVPCKDHEGEKSCQKSSPNAESTEDVQGGFQNILTPRVPKQRRSKDPSLPHGFRTNLERPTNAEDNHCNSTKRSSPSNSLNVGKQDHAWRAYEKPIWQQKALLVRKPDEPEDTIVKRKESANSVQGALQQSWKPKGTFSSKKGLLGVEDDPSNLALQGMLSVKGKDQSNHSPFSMKDFSNGDDRKAGQLQQSPQNSSLHMEHVMVREDTSPVGIGQDKSDSLSKAYMKLERQRKFHFAKKVDKKGWVVKTEAACAKAQ